MALVAHPWILLILCAAGVLIALGSLIPAVRSALTVFKHVKRARAAPIFTNFEALKKSGERIQATAAKAKPLAERARTAVQSIRRDVRESGIPQAIGAVKAAGVAVRLLVRELR